MTSKAKTARGQKHKHDAGEKNGNSKQKSKEENRNKKATGDKPGKDRNGRPDNGNDGNAKNNEPERRGRQGRNFSGNISPNTLGRLLDGDRASALCDALAQCRSKAEFGAFLADLCTPQEIDALGERWLIARLLAEGGMSYRDISAATGASTTTVGRVARFLQQEPHQGYRLVLGRMRGQGAIKNDSETKPATDRPSRK